MFPLLPAWLLHACVNGRQGLVSQRDQLRVHDTLVQFRHVHSHLRVPALIPHWFCDTDIMADLPNSQFDNTRLLGYHNYVIQATPQDCLVEVVRFQLLIDVTPVLLEDVVCWDLVVDEHVISVENVLGYGYRVGHLGFRRAVGVLGAGVRGTLRELVAPRT